LFFSSSLLFLFETYFWNIFLFFLLPLSPLVNMGGMDAVPVEDSVLVPVAVGDFVGSDVGFNVGC